MSTLSRYRALVTEKLAQSSTTFHTKESRDDAINEAVGTIAEQYEIPELIVRDVLTWTVATGGNYATIPASFFRMHKLWSTSSTELGREWTYVTPDEFDSLADTSGDYWTEDYRVASSSRVFFLKPTTITSTNIRFQKTPVTMSQASDDSGISSHWDEVIAYWGQCMVVTI